MATANLTLQNWFSTTLSSGISASDTTISLNSLPTGTEGYLVIEPDNATSREIIYYTSKTGSAVLCPSAAAGRGVDGTTATSHSAGATVKMTVTSAYWKALQDGTALNVGAYNGQPFAQGWITGATLPTSTTYLGQGSYQHTYASSILGYKSVGMRNRYTWTSTPATQCTSLNGTTQYWNKTTALSGTLNTITDDITIVAKVKLTSYPGAGTSGYVVSRFNGTSGWGLRVESTGQLALVGFNGGAANLRAISSYQSLPLNKWVTVSASLDMSGYPSLTTNKMMFGDVDVPVLPSQSGTNPTAWVNAGNLEWGSANGGTNPFPGKIAQGAIFNGNASTVTQSFIRTVVTQPLTGSETNCIGAWSFNGSANDLTANANNLSANGSAGYSSDSPFSNDAQGTPSSSYSYSITTQISSDGLTETVQVPEANTIAVSGITAMAYSPWKSPLGFRDVDSTNTAIRMTTFTTSSANVQIDGLSVTVKATAGKTLRISLYLPYVYNNTGVTNTDSKIWLGTPGSGTQLASSRFTSAGANYASSIFLVAYYTPPSSGDLTFNASLSNVGGGTATVTSIAGSVDPLFLTAEYVTPL